MIQYKNGIFCSICGSYVEVPTIGDTIECESCHNRVPLMQMDFQYYVEEKSYNNSKPWIEEFYNTEKIASKNEEPENTQTIEQRCISKNCDSNVCYYTARQMRSADEGETIFYQCIKCSVRFTLNN